MQADAKTSAPPDGFMSEAERAAAEDVMWAEYEAGREQRKVDEELASQERYYESQLMSGGGWRCS